MYNINLNMNNATTETLTKIIQEGIIARSRIDSEIISSDIKRLASFIKLDDFNLYYALKCKSKNIIEYMLNNGHYAMEHRLIKPLFDLLIEADNEYFSNIIQNQFIRGLLHKDVGQYTLNLIDNKNGRHVYKHKMCRLIDYLYLHLIQHSYNHEYLSKLITLLKCNYDINYMTQSFNINYLFRDVYRYKTEIEAILNHMILNHFNEYVEISNKKSKTISEHGININEQLNHDEIDIMI